MINAGTVAAFLTLDTGKFDKGIKGANAQLRALGDDSMRMRDKLKGVGSALTDIGTTMTTNVTLPLAGAGLAALGVAANFDEGMSKVAAISGATGNELDALRNKAREMGAKTKFSATEAASAFEYMAMAGWKTEEMMNGIEGIMNLAAASGEDLATTSDIVTDALTAFGLKAKDSGHFADILAAASSNANTNVGMMGETFKYVAPVAGALGISAEDTAEAIGLMANAGIKSSQAGTSLRSILTRLSTDAGASSKSLGALGILTQELGVDFYDANGKVRDFGDVLNDARKQWKTLSEEDASRFAKKIAGQEGISAWLAMMNAAPADVEKLSSAIANCDGTAEHMAETMQGNLKGQLTILKSQTEELAISVGTQLMPSAQSLVGTAQGIVDKFNGLDSGAKRMIVDAGLVTAAIGPTAIVLGKVTSGVGALITTAGSAAAAFTTAGGGIAGFGAAALSVIGPAGLVVAGLAAVAGVGIAIYKDFHRAKTKLKEFNDVMAESEETSKKIDEITVSLDGLKEARLDSYSNALGEIVTVEHLGEKLDELVDDNGKLIGSKEELKSVVQQLNSKGFNVELNKTGDLVKNYKDLKNSVADYVEQKKAQAMLDSLEPEYQDALKEKAKYYAAYSESIGEAMRLQKLLSDEEYVQGLSVKEYQDLCDAYTELSGKANEAFSKYQSACDKMDVYDKSMAAIAKGDFKTATELLSGYYADIGSTIKKKSDYAQAEQEKAITELSEQFKQHIQTYGMAMQSGDEAVLNDAKTYLEQAATELEAAGVKLPEWLIKGIEKGSISVERAMTELGNVTNSAIDKITADSTNQSSQKINQLKTDLIDSLNSYETALNQGLDYEASLAKNHITEIVSKLDELGIHISEVMIAGLMDGSLKFDDVFQQIGNASIDQIEQQKDKIIGPIQAGADEAAATIENGGNKLSTAAENACNLVSKEFDKLPGKAETASSNAVEGIIGPWTSQENCDAMKNAAKGYVDIIPDTAKKELDEHSPSKVMQKIGGFAAVGLINGLIERRPSALAAMKSTMDGMLTAARGVSFTHVGTNVISGILAGLNEKKPTLLTAAQGIANSISGVMRRVLKINSPSKVTMAIGRGVTEGVELGMNKGKDSLYRTASEISTDTADVLAGISRARYDYQTPTTDYGDRLDRLLDAVERLTASEPVMQVDGRPFGRLVREYV